MKASNWYKRVNSRVMIDVTSNVSGASEVYLYLNDTGSNARLMAQMTIEEARDLAARLGNMCDFIEIQAKAKSEKEEI